MDQIFSIMTKPKANQKPMFKMPIERLRSVIPQKYDDTKIEEYVMNACEHYSRYLERARKNRGER